MTVIYTKSASFFWNFPIFRIFGRLSCVSEPASRQLSLWGSSYVYVDIVYTQVYAYTYVFSWNTIVNTMSSWPWRNSPFYWVHPPHPPLWLWCGPWWWREVAASGNNFTEHFKDQVHRMLIEDMKRSLPRPHRIDSTIGDSQRGYLYMDEALTRPPPVDVGWVLWLECLNLCIYVCVRFGENGCD